jgi:hypothetical protein
MYYFCIQQTEIMAKIKIKAKPSAKKTFSYKADSKIKEKADDVAKDNGTTLSTLISEFIVSVAKNKV